MTLRKLTPGSLRYGFRAPIGQVLKKIYFLVKEFDFVADCVQDAKHDHGPDDVVGSDLNWKP